MRENVLDEEGKVWAIRMFAFCFIMACIQVYSLQQTHIEMCYKLCDVQLMTPIYIDGYSCTCARVSNVTRPDYNWTLVTPVPTASVVGRVS
jgi:hypothetical protein